MFCFLFFFSSNYFYQLKDIRDVKPLQHATITFFTGGGAQRSQQVLGIIKKERLLAQCVVLWMATTYRSQCCGFIKWVMWSLYVWTCSEKVFSGEVDVWVCAVSVPNVLRRREKLVYPVYWQHWLNARNHTPSTNMQYFGLLICFLL